MERGEGRRGETRRERWRGREKGGGGRGEGGGVGRGGGRRGETRRERWRGEGEGGEGGGVVRGGGRYCSCNFICCHCCACSVWRGASAFSEPCELCLMHPFLQMSVFHHAIGLVRILDHGFPAEKVDILDAEEDEVCLSIPFSLSLSLSLCVCVVCVCRCVFVCVWREQCLVCPCSITTGCLEPP